MSEIRSLTGLRGIAALFVTLYHFQLFNFLPGALLTIVAHGYLAVDLFFVLSGFVMAMVYASSFSSFHKETYKKFLLRRIARIYPLYIVVTLIAIGFFAFNPEEIRPDLPLNFKNIFANILMIQAWGIGDSFARVTWSLSTEFAAYVLFPFLIFLTITNSKAKATAVFISCLATLWVFTMIPREITGAPENRGPLALWDGDKPFGILKCLIEFTMGMIAFRVARLAKVAALTGREVIPVLLLLLTLTSLAIEEGDILFVALLPALIACLYNEKTFISKMMGWSLIHWLGLISYSLYLVHFAFIVMKPQLKTIILANSLPMPNLLTIGILTLCSIGVAAITYYFIEKPGRDLLRYLFEGRRKALPEPNPNLSPP